MAIPHNLLDLRNKIDMQTTSGFRSALCLLITVFFSVTLKQTELHAQTRVLFIGNSYTAANNLPQLFVNLSASMGDSVQTAMNTPGGYTFQLHSSDANTLSLIHSQPWDFVVLQEQSQRPSFPPAQVAVEVLPYARQLDSLILLNNPCSETVFYMTWGRKYGDASNCAAWPPVCTFSGMQQQLRQAYLQMGDDNNALVAPCGMAWQESWTTDSSINLWIGDNSHPSLEGSYLTACVFYATIFRKSPLGANYTAGLQPTVAGFLQQVAHQTVFDSLSTWNIGEFDPEASFSAQPNALAVQFDHTGSNCSQFDWDFGDGQSGAGPSPLHLYAQGGTYPVTLIAGNGCSDDTTTQMITLSATGISESDRTDCIEQAGETIRFHCAVRELDLFSVDGRLLNRVMFPSGTPDYTLPSTDQGALLMVFTLGDGTRLIRKTPVVR